MYFESKYEKNAIAFRYLILPLSQYKFDFYLSACSEVECNRAKPLTTCSLYLFNFKRTRAKYSQNTLIYLAFCLYKEQQRQIYSVHKLDSAPVKALQWQRFGDRESKIWRQRELKKREKNQAEAIVKELMLGDEKWVTFETEVDTKGEEKEDKWRIFSEWNVI